MIDQILDDIQAILLSLLVKIGPFFVALMPALFVGYAIFIVFEASGPFLAFAFAITVGLAIETVGIVATHTAIDLYNGWRLGAVDVFKFLLMLSLVPFYIVAVSGTIWFAEKAFTPLVQGLGMASPVLTCIVYIAVALTRDLAEIKDEIKEKRLERRDARSESKRLELERFRIEQETRAKVEIAKVKHSAALPNVAGRQTKERGTLPEWCGTLPEDRKHFRQLVESGDIQLPENITGAELAEHIPTVGSPRSGQNWLSDVRNGNH